MAIRHDKPKEQNLAPSLRIVALVDGREVPNLQVSCPGKELSQTGSNTWRLRPGDWHALTLSAQVGGAEYTGKLHVSADWKGERSETVTLKPVFNGVVTLPDGVRLEMAKIPAGSFMMGSPEGEDGHEGDEKQHQVTITQTFWLGKYEVTQAQWEAVMGNNPSHFKNGNDYPVEMVSWEDAEEFCEKLNKTPSIHRPAGYRFDLPTEAQWEYACRAGTTTAFHFGASLNGKEANCDGRNQYGTDVKEGPYVQSTTTVGHYNRPNAWGLHDMHGNVWEWCRDRYGDCSDDATDPVGWAVPHGTSC